MRAPKKILCFTILISLMLGCNTSPEKGKTLKTDDSGNVILTDEQVENIVKRAYQYIALYNVNNKFAMSQRGWNTLQADTKLKDHTLRAIARPNNDSFYKGIMLDLRAEPYIVSWPILNMYL